jgi:hypothetical protein
VLEDYPRNACLSLETQPTLSFLFGVTDVFLNYLRGIMATYVIMCTTPLSVAYRDTLADFPVYINTSWSVLSYDMKSRDRLLSMITV